MFPPGNASADDALRLHLEYRQAWFQDMIGPLLVPASAWREFGAAHAHTGSPPVTVVVIGSAELPGAIPPGVRVQGFELAVPVPPLPETGDRSLAAEFAVGPEGDAVLSAVVEAADEGRSVVAKFRTGGVVASAFPSKQTLAAVLVHAFELGAPLKLTAGLHHAVRFTDARTGFEHHGFVNVLAAARLWLAGASVATIESTLAERDASILSAALAQVTDDEAARIRAGFVSFGCCGVTEPVDDLVGLGLLAPEGAS